MGLLSKIFKVHKKLGPTPKNVGKLLKKKHEIHKKVLNTALDTHKSETTLSRQAQALSPQDFRPTDRVSALTNALQDAFSDGDMSYGGKEDCCCSKKADDSYHGNQAAASQAPAPQAHSAPSHASSAQPAQSHAPASAPMSVAPGNFGHQTPTQNADTMIQALVGKVLTENMSGRSSQQSMMYLQQAYQNAGGDNSRSLSPQTKQMVQLALGGMNSQMRQYGSYPMMNSMSRFLGY